MVHGRPWQARSVAGEELGANNPFKLLADVVPGDVDMSDRTLVVVAVRLEDGGPGFVLLSRTADAATGYAGHGEVLLDETCRAASGAEPQ